MRLLFIEDDARAAVYLQRGLTESGHVVGSAADGETGLALAQEGIYDALMVDRMLPAIGGLAMVRGLREADARTPALMLSAIAPAPDRAAGLAVLVRRPDRSRATAHLVGGELE